MPKPLKIVALLLLAVWLPATLHCGLEAAGLTIECDDGPVAADIHACQGDACDMVEGGSYAKTMASPRVLPPSVVVDLWRLLVMTAPSREETVSESPADEPPQVRVLRRSWSFARRTALPARAPDLAV